MEGSMIDLSKYRFQSAKEELETARLLRSVTALAEFDSSKHSGVIAFFNRTYVKEGVFDKSISKLVDTAYRLREKADYQDFIIISKDQAIEQIEKAEKVLGMIEPYLEGNWNI